MTRWNSILFMIRSVLKLKSEDFKRIRDEMVAVNANQKDVREKFALNDHEREMLTELKIVLEWFEFVTDELQSNKINISRVLPCVEFLKKKLINKKPLLSEPDYDDWVNFPHTTQLRRDLMESLEKRFSELVKGDMFMVSTFLDPTFGVDYFDEEKKTIVQARVISLVKQQQTISQLTSNKMTVDASNFR